MTQVRANGLDIAYESMEPSSVQQGSVQQGSVQQGSVQQGGPLLLIMGVGAQLVYWPDGFCEQLVARGFRVIRFDNRDVGLSTKLEGARAPDLYRLLARNLVGLRTTVPYTLMDMADDAAGLLDALDIERAHVVGVSMGGMVAQTMAITHPHRLLSLTSMMSHTGEARFQLASPAAVRVLLRPPPRSRNEAMDRAVEFYRVVGSTAYELDLEATRDRAARSYDRCFYPPGFARQMAAILASRSRRQALGFVRVPTLVIHGSCDPLIRPAGGRATARAIDGAELLIVSGMGHDLPAGAWPRLVAAIDANARRAASRTPAR